ncbi:Ig-like domain-containing protein [Carboxylicivirga marina]|uniref:Ig-like domain-containing protein n=1 Tax=Carboxylicivirga marina TaxID=2800988 RepID=UPI0025967987|nr:Ig-like domain-containing protein [uncultured Carboxylicivirga sp.]
MKTKLINLALFTSVLFILFSCENEIKDIQITGINLLETNVILEVDSSIALTINIEPENSSKSHISWISTDTTVAKVSNAGVVHGIQPGILSIIVKSEQGYSDTCKVNVARISIYETNDDINFGGECIALDKKNNIWYGGRGLYKMESESWEQVQFPYETFVNAIDFDSENNLWAATGIGLLKFDGQMWYNYSTDYSDISLYGLNSIAIDNDDNVWVGIYKDLSGKGVAKFDGLTWQIYNTEDGLLYGLVYNMVSDQTNNIWFATGEGVSMFDGTTWTSYATNEALDIEIDLDNNVWFTSVWAGVYKSNTNMINYNTSNSSINSDVIQSIGIDVNGDKLFAYPRGLTKLSGNEWINYSYDDVGIYNIRSIVVDKNGTKWLGSPSKIFKLED